MLTQDYLVRMLVDFAAGIMRAMQRQTEERDPRGGAELLEAAVGQAVDIDGDALLALAPESMATVLQVSGTEPALTEYMARSLMLAASYRSEAGQAELAELRANQARALATAYGHDISDMDVDGAGTSSDDADQAMKAFLNQSND
ncbi:hypothetical protein [Adlercreutzia murintestinalis]|uniref:hypothetical protein n=1 Tax=Adlercreutzia murintestinalis TaxID=2941325 RepID=UPI00204153F7|nr:hypothetical protein [Adlercreutzia murintestinalis]